MPRCETANPALGGFVQMAWNKVHDDAELDWWAERALATARDMEWT
jgi:hypothetical protein